MDVNHRRVQYTFGNRSKEVSTKTYTLTVGLDERLPLGTLELCELEGGAPPLLSKDSHRKLGLVVDYGDSRAYSKLLGGEVPIDEAKSGHHMMRLDAYCEPEVEETHLNEKKKEMVSEVPEKRWIDEMSEDDDTLPGIPSNASSSPAPVILADKGVEGVLQVH